MSTYLIDGTNLCGWTRQVENDQFSLLPLMSLADQLRRLNGDRFLCIFDANTRFKLRDAGQEPAYKDLLGFKGVFVEVTGGIRADDFLLQEAHSNGLQIITNDRFRDYSGRYAWLAKEDRLIKGAVLADKLSLPRLGLSVRVENDSAKSLKRLRECLAPEFDKKTVVITEPHLDQLVRRESAWGIRYAPDVLLRGYKGTRCSLFFGLYGTKLVQDQDGEEVCSSVDVTPSSYDTHVKYSWFCPFARLNTVRGRGVITLRAYFREVGDNEWALLTSHEINIDATE